MKFFTKKRIVLFLLFIFPLICFLLLSTGENNFKKLPIVTENIIDISEIDASNQASLKDHVSIVCFLGQNVRKNSSGLLNLNEKIYKKFLDYKKFQIVAIYPKGLEKDIDNLKDQLGAFTDMQKWVFVASSPEEIIAFHQTLKVNEPLVNLSSTKAFLVDKAINLRGRLNDEDTKGGKMYGYNMNSVSVLKSKLKDDVNVLFYEYYAAFKTRNENKADRKEVGL